MIRDALLLYAVYISVLIVVGVVAFLIWRAFTINLHGLEPPTQIKNMDRNPSVGGIVVLNMGGELHPAMVMAVNADGSINVTVFFGPLTLIRNGVNQGPGYGEWSWPERVA